MAFLSCARGKKRIPGKRVFVEESNEPGRSGPAGPSGTMQQDTQEASHQQRQCPIQDPQTSPGVALASQERPSDRMERSRDQWGPVAAQ